MSNAALIACTRCAISKARCDRKVSRVIFNSSVHPGDIWNLTADSNIASRSHALNVSREATYASLGVPRAGCELPEDHLEGIRAQRR